MDSDLNNEFMEIETVQRQLGVAISQLSTTLKHFEVIYGSISKIHSIKRQMFVDMELLQEEKIQIQQERKELEIERKEILLLRKEVETLKIEHTADSLLTVLKKNSQLIDNPESQKTSETSETDSVDDIKSNLSIETYSQVGVQTALNLFQSASQTMKDLLQ